MTHQNDTNSKVAVHLALTGQLTQLIDSDATNQFVTVVQKALKTGYYMSQNGLMILNLRVDFGKRVNILWYYMPKPDVIVPMGMLRPSGQLDLAHVSVGMRNDRPI